MINNNNNWFGLDLSLEDSTIIAGNTCKRILKNKNVVVPGAVNTNDRTFKIYADNFFECEDKIVEENKDELELLNMNIDAISFALMK